MDDGIEIYAKGLVYCSVCAPNGMTVKEVERKVNIYNPTGVSSRWKISPNKTFKDGLTNPCKCENDSSKLHYLCVC